MREYMKDKRENKYIETANLYDYDVRSTAKDDIPFYLEYAKKANGDILELGCGTGRLTIPLAKENLNIWGLDLSEPMLEIIKSKIENLPDKYKKNIHISHQNMASFKLENKFGMIFIPFRTFQSLTSSEEQRSCLKAVYEHLNDDGLFIVNVFKPNDKIDRSWINKEEVKNWETVDAIKDLKIVRKEIRDDIDVENQIIFPVLYYYVTDKNGITKKYTENLSLKFYYEDQIKTLLENNGFEIMEEFGYYNKIPIKDGKEIILVCRKKK
jgi:SAM-dependent methyltransferase